MKHDHMTCVLNGGNDGDLVLSNALKMSTTTQILFNSPALNSLKRDQLVKLCKIHSLKANGKNKDIIERLQLHAQTLPPDDPLSIATRGDTSEDEEDDIEQEMKSIESMMARPSEQWEIVMDSIAEVDEDAVSTLKNNRAGNATQAGEFGTNGGKASVSSSLKAIATSLGLKRGNVSAGTTATTSSKSSLNSTQSGQSQSTAPTEPEPEVEPVPGQNALAGLPAPANARLSISQEPATTTIRLVASNAPRNSLFSPPRLDAFKTSFDLAPPTPGGVEGGGIWPLSPGGAQCERLYPAIPTFSAFQPTDTSDMDIDVDFPGSLQSTTPARTKFNTGATPKSGQKPSDIPKDLFSPAPRLTRAREHMASFRPQRSPEKPSGELGIPRSEPFIFGSPNPQHRLSNAQFRSAAQSVLDEMNSRLEAEGVAGVDIDVLKRRQQSIPGRDDPQQEKKASTSTLFDKAHQAQFDKMDSITNHYAARRGLPPNAEAVPVLGKRKSVAPVPIAGKKRQSSIVVKKDRVPSTSSVRLRPVSKKVVPGGFGDNDDDDDGEEEDDWEDDRRKSKRIRIDPAEDAEREREDAKKLKEREAIRRKLDANKAKRRSSMGRPSIGKGVAHQPKQTSRFGFLSSAKNLVTNVWNRGAAGSKSNVPAAKPAPAPPTKTVAPSISSKPTKDPPKAQSTTKKTSIIPGSSGAPPTLKERVLSVSNGKRVPSGSSLAPVADSTSSRTSKSPIPLLPAPGTSSRMSHSRTNSATGVSSLGVASRTSNTGHVSSMGTKTSLVGTLKGTIGGTARARNSTLMAPTASSLAKTSRMPVPSFSPLQVKDKAKEKGKEQDTAEQVVNSPTIPRTQSKIFSQPLTLVSPTSKPSEPQMSLAAVAATLVTVKPPIPPKPKVMLGRRPRISRGKVIAKLASQREAQQAGASAIPKPQVGTSSSRASASVPKVRSSMGANVGRGRQSHSVARAGGDVLMSAKKRTRRSEYARRRSRVDGEKMDLNG
ncbi:uncharacterized protein EDB91DRAFT_1132694 [Suillus paluster]|uniref:uncharacterized protein n=1 Tax=Suillus paluster TaxID=48578 RepID=UPI001B85ED9C|nr:uncharacterized protein EDB91DRAFT_1132694 [Suillus paluster]KAG1740483.1 hypothetical protein EDB91DRAFT_1132694 [Suillus paluster]